MKLRTGSKDLIREINEALVLDVVRRHESVSRSLIATNTGLSHGTVTGITAKLLQAGILTEAESVQGTMGRPARLLRLGTGAVFAAGVHVSASHAIVVLVNLLGAVVDTHSEKLDSTAPGTVAAAIIRGVERVSAKHSNSQLFGVGVAISGIVDPQAGLVRHSGLLGWEDVQLEEMLNASLTIPATVDSYVNSLASQELLFDKRMDQRDDLLIFSIGTSLGMAVVVGGTIHRGHDGTAGGFAHSRTSPGPEESRPCHCGAMDCLEAWSSGWGIANALERHNSPAETAGAYRSQETIYNAAVTRLATAMANACKVLGPRKALAVLSPELDRMDIASRTQQEFTAQFAHGHTAAPTLELRILDEMDIGRGAAYTVLSKMFNTEMSSEKVET